MKKRSKRFKSALQIFDKNKTYTLEEALGILKKMPPAKFDESVDLSFRLGVDPKQSDQFVRGSVLLPHGTGKKVRVLVFCKGEAEKSAKEAGADYVGGVDLIEKISSGWLDFDVAIAHPEMMRDISRLGKILGPRGLMPNPKSGTVTTDLVRAISDFKKGKVEFKMDKTGNLGLRVGKISFTENQLSENVRSALEAVFKTKPPAFKGQFIKNVVISKTMGPGIKIDWTRYVA
ncbi:MAG: 50S ribosomal protein L1 [Candidatus Omnitrophica bacterium]|nr:50S ribosomal protein L1 [Candidatus Omnitrophota bacterium]